MGPRLRTEEDERVQMPRSARNVSGRKKIRDETSTCTKVVEAAAGGCAG